MIKNYLKVALRNLWKNKVYSAINIVGLSAGLAVFLLIVLYVKDELSYNKYNALLIAIVTISLRAVKAVVTNPVKSLRTE